MSLVAGTFLNIRSPAKWRCSANRAHGVFSATPKQILYTTFNCPKCSKASKLTETIVSERLSGRQIELINGTLKGSDKKATWRCLRDQTHPIWKSTPTSVLNNKSGCPVCSGKLPLTEKDIQKKLDGKDIELVSRSYDQKLRKARFRCLADKTHEQWTTGVKSVLYQNTGCPTCRGTKKITESDAKKRLKGRAIELIPGTLLGARRNASWRCLNDSAHPIWNATPSSVLNGSNCPACTGHERLSPEVIKRKLKTRPISLLSKSVKGSIFKAKWTCLSNDKHHAWLATVGSVLAGSGCPECGGNAKLSESQINKRLTKRRIRVVKGTFISSSKYATWVCLEDKSHPEWRANVSSILGGVGCPLCAEYGFKEHQSAFIYILKVGPLSKPSALKVGITNNHPKLRRGQISRRSDHEVTLYRHWEHQSGSVIRQIEKKLRKSFPHKDLGKSLADGGTETYFPRDLRAIESEVEKLLKYSG